MAAHILNGWRFYVVVVPHHTTESRYQHECAIDSMSVIAELTMSLVITSELSVFFSGLTFTIGPVKERLCSRWRKDGYPTFRVSFTKVVVGSA
jgi:hypothetical protein